jgi:hypothetical protein
MARRRGPPWGLILGGFAVVTVVAMTAAAVGFRPAVVPPEDTGVCWRVQMQDEKPDFRRLAHGVPNLESCAAHLEAIYLRRGPQVGAYQGRFIFVDDEAIRSAKSLDGSRWRVFFDPQRADLDKKLRGASHPPQVFTAPAR